MGCVNMFCFRESEVEVWACNFPLVLIPRDSEQFCLKTGHADCRDLRGRAAGSPRKAIRFEAKVWVCLQREGPEGGEAELSASLKA